MAVEEPSGPGELGLEELYKRYAPALLALCRRRLRDASRAEDAVHETLLRADKARGSFREGAPVWPWLATIAANVCTDMARRDARLHLVAEPDHTDLAPDAAHDVERRGKRRLLREALASLPLADRRSVFLHHFAGLTHDEIAEHEGTTPAAVRSRLMRARRLLRERVEQLATQRGDWPVPAAAPILRRVQVALGRVEPAVAERTGTAAQYVAALLFVTGVIAGSGGVAGVAPAADAAASVPRVAAAASANAPTAAAGTAVSVHGTPRGVSASVRAPIPKPPVRPPLFENKVKSPVAVREGDDQTLIDIGWNCGSESGRPSESRITQLLCDTFPGGLTPS